MIMFGACALETVLEVIDIWLNNPFFEQTSFPKC